MNDLLFRIVGRNDSRPAFRQVVDDTDKVAATMRRATTVTRAMAWQQRNLSLQLIDTAQMMALGQPFYLTLLQQGPQIAQIWGPDEGGVGRAFQETGKMLGGLVVKFAPFLAIVGAGAAAVAGMTHEINKTSDVTVSFGDTALATFQVIAGGIYQWIQPAVNAIAPWFQTAWEMVVGATRTAGNWIIREMVGAFEIIKTGVLALPAFFTKAGEAAANGFVGAMEWMVNQSLAAINAITEPLRALGPSIAAVPGIGSLGSAIAGLPPMQPITLDRVDFGASAAQAEIDALFEALDQNRQQLADWDPLGDLFGEIQQQAIANATDRIEDLGGAAGAANDNAKKLGDTLSEAAKKAKEEWDFYRATFTGFIQDLGNGLKQGESFWESFRDAALNALNKILDRWVEMMANNLFSAIFGGLFGGGFTSPSGFVPGGYYPAFPSYAGGGFTGSGARAGGLDGMGGFLAMLHPGETVFDHQNPANANGMRHANSNGVLTIRIVDQSGQEVTRTSMQGGQEVALDVTLDQLVAKKIATPGSETSRALASRFGLSERLARR